MKMKTIGAIIALFALIGFPALSNATVTTFSGQDMGAYPDPEANSLAAQSSFTAAAALLGPLNTITFETLTVGYYTPFTAAPGVTVTLHATDVGPDFSGIVDHPYSSTPAVYGFNTTPEGRNWLGFPGASATSQGSVTFDFAVPTQSFGMYLTGLQDPTYTGSLTISFNDGTGDVVLNLLPVNDVTGGVKYFGFTDPGAQITRITIANSSVGSEWPDYPDAWGIDDVTYNIVPVPPAVWLFGSGLLGLVGWRRLRKG